MYGWDRLWCFGSIADADADAGAEAEPGITAGRSTRAAMHGQAGRKASSWLGNTGCLGLMGRLWLFLRASAVVKYRSNAGIRT
jgi:hypothetical protein